MARYWMIWFHIGRQSKTHSRRRKCIGRRPYIKKWGYTPLFLPRCFLRFLKYMRNFSCLLTFKKGQIQRVILFWCWMSDSADMHTCEDDSDGGWAPKARSRGHIMDRKGAQVMFVYIYEVHSVSNCIFALKSLFARTAVGYFPHFSA